MKFEDLPNWAVETLKNKQTYLERMGLSYTLEELYEMEKEDKEY